MKKLIVLVLASVILLCLTLAACNSSSSTTKSGYLKHFPYILSYGDMQLQVFEKVEDTDYAKAIYLIKSTENAVVLKEYVDKLIKDDWVVYEDQHPISVGLKKDNHVLMLVPSYHVEEKNVYLMVIAK